MSFKHRKLASLAIIVVVLLSISIVVYKLSFQQQQSPASEQQNKHKPQPQVKPKSRLPKPNEHPERPRSKPADIAPTQKLSKAPTAPLPVVESSTQPELPQYAQPDLQTAEVPTPFDEKAPLLFKLQRIMIQCDYLMLISYVAMVSQSQAFKQEDIGKLGLLLIPIVVYHTLYGFYCWGYDYMVWKKPSFFMHIAFDVVTIILLKAVMYIDKNGLLLENWIFTSSCVLCAILLYKHVLKMGSYFNEPFSLWDFLSLEWLRESAYHLMLAIAWLLCMHHEPTTNARATALILILVLYIHEIVGDLYEVIKQRTTKASILCHLLQAALLTTILYSLPLLPLRSLSWVSWTYLFVTYFFMLYAQTILKHGWKLCGKLMHTLTKIQPRLFTMDIGLLVTFWGLNMGCVFGKCFFETSMPLGKVMSISMVAFVLSLRTQAQSSYPLMSYMLGFGLTWAYFTDHGTLGLILGAALLVCFLANYLKTSSSKSSIIMDKPTFICCVFLHLFLATFLGELCRLFGYTMEVASLHDEALWVVLGYFAAIMVLVWATEFYPIAPAVFWWSHLLLDIILYTCWMLYCRRYKYWANGLPHDGGRDGAGSIIFIPFIGGNYIVSVVYAIACVVLRLGLAALGLFIYEKIVPQASRCWYGRIVWLLICLGTSYAPYALLGIYMAVFLLNNECLAKQINVYGDAKYVWLTCMASLGYWYGYYVSRRQALK